MEKTSSCLGFQAFLLVVGLGNQKYKLTTVSGIPCEMCRWRADKLQTWHTFLISKLVCGKELLIF